MKPERLKDKIRYNDISGDNFKEEDIKSSVEWFDRYYRNPPLFFGEQVKLTKEFKNLIPEYEKVGNGILASEIRDTFEHWNITLSYQDFILKKAFEDVIEK